MGRTSDKQINFRCSAKQKKAYLKLAKELDKPLCEIIRAYLDKRVKARA